MFQGSSFLVICLLCANSGHLPVFGLSVIKFFALTAVTKLYYNDR